MDLDYFMATYSIPPLGQHELVELAIAGAIIFAILSIAVVVARYFGPGLAQRLEDNAVDVRFPLATRAVAIMRHLVAALLLAATLGFHDWSFYAQLAVGFTFAAASALFLKNLLLGLRISFPIVLAVSLVVFVFILSNAVGQLSSITSALDKAGFDIGNSRFSLLTIIKIVLALVILFALIRLANRGIKQMVRRNKALDEAQKLLTEKLAAVAILIAAFFVGIDMLGIDITAFAVFSGAFGLAIGFGLQKTFGNLIAGIILLMDRSIKPGDVIVVGESFGWVNKIGVRAVSVITRDGKEHLIPNENLMTQEVENWSYSSKNVRVHIPVGVSYKCDIKKAQELMLQAATDAKRVLNAPKPNVWMSGFGDSSVDFEILAWIKDPQEGVGNVKSEVLNRLWDLFAENGIEIPFPQRDINVRSIDDEFVDKIAARMLARGGAEKASPTPKASAKKV